ncbi:hypothetical protein OSB04_019247 [Centaurea solstitialis]|uniref:non-specific serine/threonine protein kinase n=1 Tax=Centaurea solstitialis TaxID=347529 RepID=A0AA38SPY7_9ASTR|nr:hypothetical protein OSB04_019247 [Centaurea solstitialis]
MMSSIQELDSLRIPFEDIHDATNNFADEKRIGRGCFGKVYKGKLQTRDGFVSIQRSDHKLGGSNGQYDPNVTFLSKYNHENIVSFVGFCVENHETIFVHEFLTHESVEKHLSSAKLRWISRIQICLAVARGLDYLHNGQEGRIGTIHGDIKSANILLDENWQAKIANLRLPETVLKQASSYPIPNERGTFGYIDPMYFQTATLTKESDIYSFGVVLFEILCGRPAVPTDVDIKGLLGPLARHHCEEGNITKIIDPILRKQMNPGSLNAFSSIAYQCLEMNRSKRPTITGIVERLENVLLLQQQSQKVSTLQQVSCYTYIHLYMSNDTQLCMKDLEKQMDHWKIPLQEIHPFTHEFHAQHRIGWEKYLEHWKIPLDKIVSATNGFDGNRIGVGGFGGVYKAKLLHFDVRKYVRENKYYQFPNVELHGYPTRESEVAIKRLDKRFGQGKLEFLQEIEVLSRINHENLVSLLGFCDESNEMILIYDYASNGSLDKCIRNIQPVNSLTWQKRLQICVDMAQGLNYLHKLDLIHRDIKSANILLGYNWKGMIGDFGLSIISRLGDSQVFETDGAGTPGYADPKYARTGMLSKQSDIYSLGVVLLEVLCGRLAILPRLGDEPEFLVHMAKRHFQQKQMIQIIDRHLRKELESSSPSQGNEKLLDSINTVMKTAYECLHSTETHQLTMEKVVKELKRALLFHSVGVETFSLEAIKNATNFFSEKHVIGKGASGKVYIGELLLSTKCKVVSVKRLDRVGSYGEGAFLEDVGKLSSYIHENIIPLRGFCEEGNEKIIILEHAINGSLDKHLHNSTLTWGLRLKISIGIAKGLHHTHTFDEAQHIIHGDIKSSNILLDEDWKAMISNLIIPKANYGTLAYLDPLHCSVGLTKKSDVYSFGVVLFEILSGMLAVEEVGKYLQANLQNIINVEDETDAGEASNNEQVVFLSQVVAQCFKENKLEALIFDGIKEQTSKKSIDVFSDIAYRCLSKDIDERPTMAQVLDALENASKIHEEWESEQRLPRDYENIIKISGNLISMTSTKTELYSLLCSGILLKREKVTRIPEKTRFPKVAKILDISNLDIRIQITTQYLTPRMLYGAYVVFKFCDRRKVSSRPLYVNLKYRVEGKALHAYFAEWKDGGSWLTIELFRFWSNKGIFDLDIVLEGFSRYYCGSGAIVVEGIEFQRIHSVSRIKRTDGTNIRGPLESKRDDLDQRDSVTNYEKIIKRIGDCVQNASDNDLYDLHSKGILIDNGEKFVSICKVNGKICHMLPAKAVLHNSSYVKFCNPPTEFRFVEVAEVQSHQDFRIKCDIETQMLSSDTTYTCFLVFTLSEKCRGLNCPVKARDLLPNRKQRTNIMSFTSPTLVNLDKIKWIPNDREDGWMEVIVWETSSDDSPDEKYVPMDLKLICFEGTMSGLIVRGIEFRPTEIGISDHIEPRLILGNF